MAQRKGRPKSPNVHGGFVLFCYGLRVPSVDNLASLLVLDPNPAEQTRKAQETLRNLADVDRLVGLDTYYTDVLWVVKGF